MFKTTKKYYLDRAFALMSTEKSSKKQFKVVHTSASIDEPEYNSVTTISALDYFQYMYNWLLNENPPLAMDFETTANRTTGEYINKVTMKNKTSKKVIHIHIFEFIEE